MHHVVWGHANSWIVLGYLTGVLAYESRWYSSKEEADNELRRVA